MKTQWYAVILNVENMSCSMTNPTKWHVGPAKTQISLGICPIWSHSSLSACRSLPIERTTKTLIRLGGCPGLSESSLRAHVILLVFVVRQHIYVLQYRTEAQRCVIYGTICYALTTDQLEGWKQLCLSQNCNFPRAFIRINTVVTSI